MTDREKLIDIINTACEGYAENLMQPYGAEVLADYLIANGARISPWISVKYRPPEVEKRVLLLTDKGVTCGFYEDGKMWQDDSKVNWDYDMDLDYDEDQDAYRIPEGWVEESLEEHDEWNCVVLSYKVTHWMPLPEPPKEE